MWIDRSGVRGRAGIIHVTLALRTGGQCRPESCSQFFVTRSDFNVGTVQYLQRLRTLLVREE
jgi:hypothetical protein